MAGACEYSIVRLETSDDLDAVARLEAESFSNPWSREILARDLRNPDVSRVYVLRARDGALLAFCACWFIADELHINTLAVKAHARRQGLATRLLRFIFAEASGLGIGRATLEVRRSNEPALKLYAALGFTVQGIRTNYYSQPVEDGLILWSHQLETETNPQP